jgi:hypothetical protein
MVSNSKSTVDGFDVIYVGETFEHWPIIAPPITLAQAVKVHSLQKGAKAPIIRYASNDRGEIYGVVDLANRIAYTTKTPPALAPRWIGENQVVEVSYFSPTAPLLENSTENLLRDGGEATLLGDAKSSALYSSGYDTPISAKTKSGNSSDMTARAMRNPSGPFGFEFGMTRGQIITLLGKDAIEKESKGDVIVLKTAPNPHSDFEDYAVIISPTAGLLKVSSFGKTVETGDSGVQLRQAFYEIVAAVTQKYGTPSEVRNFCDGSEIKCDSQFWMMSLKDKNRHLSAAWSSPSSSNRVANIWIEAISLNVNSGYVTCSFEFSGFADYIYAKKAHANESY